MIKVNYIRSAVIHRVCNTRCYWKSPMTEEAALPFDLREQLHDGFRTMEAGWRTTKRVIGNAVAESNRA